MLTLNNIYCGNCVDLMKLIPDDFIDVTIVDPPYGCKKASWDDSFPTDWYNEAKRCSKMICIITGSVGLKDSIKLVGDDFIDVIAARNLNGMTRSAIGYGNWLAVVIALSKPQLGQNVFNFVVSGKKPDHPAPKPIDFMDKLIKRLSHDNDIILDPFVGSGSTIIACIKNGRKYIGIDINQNYINLCYNRIKELNRD